MYKCKNNVGAHDCAQKGITLIALVITIIVMLVLVAVTITMAVNGGLFDYAGKAVGDTQNAINAEQVLANGRIHVDGKWYDSIDDFLAGKESENQNGGTPEGEEPPTGDEPTELPEGIKVGDYVNYTPTVGEYTVASGANGSGDTDNQTFTTQTGENALKWRILSIDETTGEIEIVAATQTSATLRLKGADGYNHAVDILNDLCEDLYSKENEKGERIATARSINVEDINEKTTYEYTDYEDSSAGFAYGDTKQLSTYGTDYMKYPNLYSQEKGYGTAGTMNTSGLNGSEGKNDGVTDENGVTTYSTVTGYANGNTAGTDPYITFTYYYYAPESYLADLGVNTAPAGLLKTGTTYWLASRCVYAYSRSANFSVRYVKSNGDVRFSDLFSSDGITVSRSYAVRPAVSLGSGVSLTKDEDNTDTSITVWDVEF